MSGPVEEAARANFGARAEQYVTSATHADPARLGRIVEMTAPLGHWRALDVATGTGHTAFAFAPAVAWVVGVDLTDEMLRRAERMRKEQGYGNVELRTADVHHLPFADGSFDLVTCRRAAHHFSHPERALGEMRRVLKAGGRLVIDDRASPDDDAADALLHQLDTLHDRSHVRQYGAGEWRTMLAVAGFEVRALEEYSQERPLSAFTAGVDPADAAEVSRLVSEMPAPVRAVLNFQPGEGEPSLRHFYLTVVADRA